MEDYALFARMLAGGARAVNVAEPLVFYRVGAEAFKRRGGTGLLRSELRLQREFLRQRVHLAGRVRAQRAGPRRLPAGPVVVPPRGVPPAGRAYSKRPWHRPAAPHPAAGSSGMGARDAARLAGRAGA